MADISYQDPDRLSTRKISDLASTCTEETEAADSSTAYNCSLRGACGLGARANAGTRASLMHDMQRTHGNRAVQRLIGPIIPSLKPPSTEDRIMEAMRRLLEDKNGSSGESGGGAAREGGGGPLSWLTGAASKAVDWVGKGASKVAEAAGEATSGPFGMHIPDVTPETPSTPPWTPWNPYMQPELDPPISPSDPPFTPWNPYMQPDPDPFDPAWVIH